MAPKKSGVAKAARKPRVPKAKPVTTTDFSSLPQDRTKWKNNDLKHLCWTLGRTVSGNKKALVERLKDHNIPGVAMANDDGDAPPPKRRNTKEATPKPQASDAPAPTFTAEPGLRRSPRRGFRATPSKSPETSLPDGGNGKTTDGKVEKNKKQTTAEIRARAERYRKTLTSIITQMETQSGGVAALQKDIFVNAHAELVEALNRLEEVGAAESTEGSS